MNAGKRKRPPKRHRIFGRYTKQIITGLFVVLAAMITAFASHLSSSLDTSERRCDINDSLEIYFTSDSFALSGGDLQAIEDFHRQWPGTDCVMATLPGSRDCAVANLGLSIAGRADELDPSEFNTNDELSLARAEAVAKELTRLGLPVIPELVLGLGAAEPPPPGSESEEERDRRRAHERRVEVKAICVR